MSFIRSRLRRAEVAARKGPSCRCPECGLQPDGPGRIVLYGEAAPRQTLPDNPEERCGSCGRPLWTVLRCVYENAEGDDAA